MFDKQELYTEQKNLIDAGVAFIMSNPPAEKVLDTILDLYGVGYSEGMVEGINKLKKARELIAKGNKIIEEGLK